MNRSDDRPVLEALSRPDSAGARRALATVFETRGSTPRKAGTKMLVDDRAGLIGTVGGGCGEAEVIEAARQVMADGVARVVEVDLTRDLMSWSPAVCGGIMRVFVEPVAPVEAGPNAVAAREPRSTDGIRPDGLDQTP